MEKEIIYQSTLIKGDLIEIYAKTIANLGPFNYLSPKEFMYISSSFKKMPCFSMSGFGCPLFAYLSRYIMDADDPVKECVMERSSIFNYIFNGKTNRKITLENLEQGRIKVKIEDSERGVKKVRKLLDQMFNR